MGFVQSIAAALRRYDRSPAPWLETTKERGAYGERVAACFLQRQGYKILTRNFRIRRGEIDLVCRDGEILVFAEVKARASDDYGQPAEAVDDLKRQSISRAAISYLKELGKPDIYFRFDIVEVFLNPGSVPQCRLIRNAHPLSKPFFY
jgi:putative endonuclease